MHYEQLTSPQSHYFSTRFYSSPWLRFKSRSQGKTGKCSKKNEADCYIMKTIQYMPPDEVVLVGAGRKTEIQNPGNSLHYELSRGIPYTMNYSN